MIRKKTLKQHKKSLKGKSLRRSYNPGESVSMEGLKAAIVEALFEKDIDTFKGCVAILLEHCGSREVIKETGLSKTTLYRVCEPGSNPTLENITKIMGFIHDQGEKRAT